MDDGQHREREHFFASAKVIAVLTVLSRIAGMLRAMAIAKFGASAVTDAFALAFKIPNLLRRLFAEGALSAAFVPVLTETLEDKGDGLARGARLLSNAMALLALLLAGLYVLIQLGLLAWAFIWPGPADRQLMILLTSLMLPFMVTICLLALASGALNCRGHFIYPAATPIILNIIIVAAAWWVQGQWTDPAAQLQAVAVSVSVAGVVQFAGVFLLLRRSGFSLRWRLKPVEPGIGAMVRLMAPMLIGLGFLQFAELLESALAWVLRYSAADPTLNIFGLVLTKPLAEGVLPRIDNARYLYQFPMGVLAISLGVAVFPLLSRYAARGDMPNFRDSINRAIRLSFMEGMATGAGLFVLAEPITQLLFRHGKYSLADVKVTAFITQMYALGMWAYCTYQIAVRAFYSLKDTVTPLKLSCALAVLHLLVVAVLIFLPQLGAGAFGLATSLVFTVNTLALLVLLRRKVGLLGGRKMLRSFARTLAACAVMAAVLAWLMIELRHDALELLPGLRVGGPLLNLPPMRPWLVVTVTVPVGAAVFCLAARLMHAPELGELFGAVRQKIARNVQQQGAGKDPTNE